MTRVVCGTEAVAILALSAVSRTGGYLCFG